MVNQEKLFQAIQGKKWEYLMVELHKYQEDISSNSMLTLVKNTFITEFLKEISQKTQKKDWGFLIKILKSPNNRKFIKSDNSLKLALDTFITEFLNNVDNYPNDNSKIIEILEDFHSLNATDYKLNEVDHKKLICQIVKRKRNINLEEAYNYAKEYLNEEICKTVITEYERLKPKIIEHSQEHQILVTEIKEVANVDYRRNLFRSKQEKEFFMALKQMYDTYNIYPNVAISCLLDFDLLECELTPEEKKYFFKGTVDTVVFDQIEGYKPIYFFELDSIYHDTKEQKKNDNLKDSIFAKAGIKIKRIRKKDNNVATQEEFMKIIRELKENGIL